MKRQQIRRAVTLISFLLFPVTMNYLSPYLSVVGASEGVLTGSLILFGLLFLGSLFFGRAYCGWVCPAAALQETCRGVNDRPVNGNVLDKVKYLIWVPWLLGIVGLFVAAGGIRSADPLFMTETGISVDEPAKYIMYYLVVALFAGLAMAVGRRASCHTVCWMAPFMIIGSRIRQMGAWPSLRLIADQSRCSGCQQCNQHCVMGLDVSSMVKRADMRHDECVLCGECVDHCTRSAIRYTVGRSARASVDQAQQAEQAAMR